MPISTAERSRRYRERHPERFRQSVYKYWTKPYDCPCGTRMNTQNKKKHLASQKHKHLMEYQELKRKVKEAEENTESGNSTDESEAEYINSYLSNAKYDHNGLLITTDSDSD